MSVVNTFVIGGGRDEPNHVEATGVRSLSSDAERGDRGLRRRHEQRHRRHGDDRRGLERDGRRQAKGTPGNGAGDAGRCRRYGLYQAPEPRCRACIRWSALASLLASSPATRRIRRRTSRWAADRTAARIYRYDIGAGKVPGSDGDAGPVVMTGYNLNTIGADVNTGINRRARRRSSPITCVRGGPLMTYSCASTARCRISRTAAAPAGALTGDVISAPLARRRIRWRVRARSSPARRRRSLLLRAVSAFCATLNVRHYRAAWPAAPTTRSRRRRRREVRQILDPDAGAPDSPIG